MEKGRPSLSEEQVDNIITIYGNTNNIKKTALKTGFNINTVRKYIKDNRLITNKLVINKKISDDKIQIDMINNVIPKYLNRLSKREVIQKSSGAQCATITGILVDKKKVLQGEKADLVKEQSIIFQMFGDVGNMKKMIKEINQAEANIQAEMEKKNIEKKK